MGLLTLGCFVPLGCGPESRQSPADSAAEADDVERFVDEYLAAISARDSIALRDIYAADDRFVWIEDGEVRYRSADGVLASLASVPSGTSLETELDELEVVFSGEDVAHAWARFETRIGEGASAFSFSGLLSLVLERSDGSWRIIAGHTSSPRLARPSSSSDSR